MKPIWESKTIWANLVMAILAFFPAIQSHLTPEMMAMGMGALNIVLRFVTSKKIGVGG